MINYSIGAVSLNRTVGIEKIESLYDSKLDKIENLSNFFNGSWDIIRNDINWTVIKYNIYKFEFLSNNTYVVEYYDESETLVKYTLPKPNILGDFIDDMTRLNIPLFWNPHIVDNYEPHNLLDVDLIENFFREKLNNIEKGFELL